MEALNKANEKLNQLTERDVRYIYIPPMTVAAYCSKDINDSDIAEKTIISLAAELIQQKSDVRRFNFLTHKENSAANNGFELWITIPENMDVSEPLIKRKFYGGLYASYTIPCGAYDEWFLLKEWVNKQNTIEADWTSRSTSETENQQWVVEEILNYHGIVTGNHLEQMQVDLLLPIKKK